MCVSYIELTLFTSGNGPIECSWVVARVLALFLDEMKSREIAAQVLVSEKDAQQGTLKSVVVAVDPRQWEWIKTQWVGTILWVGKSKYRKHHKRKNWYIAVLEMQLPKAIVLQEKDLQFSAVRSSGPGGQHANKVNSAVRVKHLPSGLQVLAQSHRSQHRNKKLARQLLQQKWEAYTVEQRKIEAKTLWEQQVDLQNLQVVQKFEGKDFSINNIKKNFKKRRRDLKQQLKQSLDQ
ncbi:MAG: peptide chain release factor H [Flavobacteriaceae bacterium]|nr:peptide chain release factor H [Flavobacteriaceae bacterium]